MSFITQQGRTLLLAAVMMVGAVCVSNAAEKPAALVGHWLFVEGYQYKDIKSVELFSDGTGVVDGVSLTWKVENKRLIILTSILGIAADYKLSGSEIVLTYDDGKNAIFVKKEKLEEYKKKKAEEIKKEQERIRKEAEQRIEKVSSYFTDSRNGQKYRTVKIGGKTWMAQNLNYQTDNSWCYNNDNSNCETYGRLYDWYTAMTACPAGWHLPSRKEWDDLEAAAGGNVAGKALKSTYGWGENGNGADEFGFSALPGGYRTYDDGRFHQVGETGVWWTTSRSLNSSRYADFRRMFYDQVFVKEYNNEWRSFDCSVRCLQDETTATAQQGLSTGNSDGQTNNNLRNEPAAAPQGLSTDNRNGQMNKIATTGNTVAQSNESDNLIKKAVELVALGNKNTEAMIIINEILSEKPNNISALMLSGRIKVAERNFADAMEIFKKVNFINPNYAPAVYERGNIFLMQQNYEGAKAFFERALKLDPRFALAELGLAKVAKAQGGRVGSLEYKNHLQRAYELSPGNKEIQEELKRR